MNERVVITGIGVVSSVGIGKDAFWDSLLKGRSGVSLLTAFDTTNHFTHNGGEVKIFKAEQFIPEERLRLMNRATQMGVVSAKLAIEDATLTSDYLSSLKVGVSHGTTLGAAQAIERVDDLLIKKQEVRKDLFYQMPTNAAPPQ
jgi:3-oxoacyl-[acyl-carrier-protein] synthase II